MDNTGCGVALKEWAVTCEALRQGRQIVLLRKGGLLDQDGLFTLEHAGFWFFETSLHQSRHLVKPEHLDLFEAAPEHGDDPSLRLWAEVEQVYALPEARPDLLLEIPHIWSPEYIEGRLTYKPKHPLLCVALRVHQAPQQHCLKDLDGYRGCRSWVEMERTLSLERLQPVLPKDRQHDLLQQLKHVLKIGKTNTIQG